MLKIPGKRSTLILVLSFSFLMETRSQAGPDPNQKRAMDLLHKNLQAIGLNRSTLDSYRVTDAYIDKPSGNFIVYLQQAYQGIPVYNKIGVYIFKNDTLVGKKPNYIRRIEVMAPAPAPAKAAPIARPFYHINAGQAVRFAAGHLSIPVREEPKLVQKDELRQHFMYSPGGLSKRGISSDLVWLPVNDDKAILLSWNVRIASPDGNDDWFVRVDAQTGAVVEKSSLIVSERATWNGGPCEEPSADGMTPAVSVMVSSGSVMAPGLPQISPATAAIVPGFPVMLPVVPAATPVAAVMAAPPPAAVTSASYRVFPFPLESGNYGSRILDLNPWLRAGSGNNAIALGWHFDNTTNYDYTRGNNVWAQQDLSGTSATTGFADTSTAAIPSLIFDRAIDPAASPTTYSNIRAGMDNLFYWNNIMHDISYQYGFDEAAGNFQAANLGRGGLGNDYVNAFAEDGAGLNNADFQTPPDGENPRMRMFQWNTAVTTRFHVNTPAPIAIDYTVVESRITPRNQLTTTGPVTADIVQVDDPAGTHLGCGFLNNAAALAGKIALIDRGSCNFSVKILDAQNAGAIAVIVVNNVAGAPTSMTATDLTIAIPAVMISNTDGAILKANLAGLNGSLSASGLSRDGALDNGVMAHEYTHGISNRLTGGPLNTDCLANAEQMGEGWSDYLALMVTTDWSAATVGDGPKKRPLGTYVMAQPATGAGIRTYPYSTDMTINPWTYGMLATSTAGEAHTVGEIWCAAIWDMTWNIIQQEGIDADIYHGTKGNNIALQLVIQGMKYQPCSPGFLDARDAILKADSILYNYAHKCAIWHAFARRGMGKSAQQGSSNSYIDQTAATDLPLGLGITQTVDKTTLAQGDNITYTIKAYCDCSPLTNISIIDTLSGNLSYVGSSSGGVYTAPAIRFDALNFAENEVKTFTIQAKVTGGYALPDTLINDSRDPSGYSWTPTILTGGTNFTASTVRSHSPSHSWYATDLATVTDFNITSGTLLLDTISTLSFWHYFETDPTYDGGVVEISTDGGSSWQDLGPYMTQNPYNNTMDPFATGISNRRAFSGSSGGAFIQTVVSLTGFAGRSAKLRFRFTSDNFAGDEGWYIDDILLKNERGAVSVAGAFSGGTVLSRSSAFGLFGPVSLPVNFLSFTAARQDRHARLHWTVNGEINVSKYIVERSANGSDFSTIGEVPASLDASSEKGYSYIDDRPLQGDNFYRIVEKDLDDKSTVSVTKVLNFTSGITIRLSPVPTFTHSVQLELTTGEDGPVSASLINILGQAVKVYQVRQGTNFLDLEGFSKGIYFLRIRTGGNRTEIRKIVIQ